MPKDEESSPFVSAAATQAIWSETGALSAYLGRKLSQATPATSSNPSTLSDEAKAEAIHRYFQKETPAPSSAPSPMPTNLTPEAKPTTLAEMASRNPNFIIIDEGELIPYGARRGAKETPLIGAGLQSLPTAELLAMIDPRLKEIPWSKEAKRESSKMYRLLEGINQAP